MSEQNRKYICAFCSVEISENGICPHKVFRLIREAVIYKMDMTLEDQNVGVQWKTLHLAEGEVLCGYHCAQVRPVGKIEGWPAVLHPAHPGHPLKKQYHIDLETMNPSQLYQKYQTQYEEYKEELSKVNPFIKSAYKEKMFAED